jgi:large subunit ribosomal protein L24|tara:strand:+ start:539 stop:811 length:273 start_codon:yes stop_codon:yes gene_type:complete
MYKKVVKKQKVKQRNSFFVKKDDLVEVISGQQGQTIKGKISKVFARKNQVIVEGVNLRTKHVKPMKEGDTGQIVRRELPIHVSNIKRIVE